MCMEVLLPILLFASVKLTCKNGNVDATVILKFVDLQPRFLFQFYEVAFAYRMHVFKHYKKLSDIAQTKTFIFDQGMVTICGNLS